MYINVGEVVEDEGNTLIEKEVETVQNCEELCDKTEGCNSFKYCDNNPKGECYLKDKKLTGNEPSIFVDRCASYYTAGNAIFAKPQFKILFRF